MSRFGKIFTGIVVFVIVVSGAGVALMYWRLNVEVREALLSSAQQTLGVELAIDSVAFNPFSGELALSGLHIDPGGSDSTADALRAGRIEVRFDPATLGSAQIEILRIDASDIRVSLREDEQGRNNLEQLLERARASRDGEPAQARRMLVGEYNTIDVKADLETGIGSVRDLSVPDTRLTRLGADVGGLSAAALALELLRPLVNGTLEEGVAIGMIEEAPVTRQTLRDLRDLIEAIEPPPETGQPVLELPEP
jgi:hypothetical protein